MAAATLNDVMKTMREEGMQTRDTGANSLRVAIDSLNMTVNALGDINTSLKAFMENQAELINRMMRNAALLDKPKESSSPISSNSIESNDISSGPRPPLLGILAAALLIEALDLDAWFKAMRLPQTIKTIKNFITGVVKFGNGFAGVIKSIANFDFGRLLPTITMDDAKIEKLKNTVLRPFNQVSEYLKGKLSGPLQVIDDIKTSVMTWFDGIKNRITTSFTGLGTKIDGIKTSVNTWFDGMGTKIKSLIPDTPKWVTNITTSVTKFGTKIADFVKSIKIETPDILKNIKIPGLSTLKQFLFGAETAVDGAKAAGGIFSIFRGLGGVADTLLGPIKPLLKIFKLGARGIPVVGQLLSLFDFIGGFMKGFAGEDEFDEDGALVKKASDRSFMKKLGEGIEGGLLGVIKGITEGIDLLLKEVPVWILKKLGFKETAEQLNTFWEKNGSITSFIDPIWNWIKNIPTMLMDLIPSAEDIRTLVAENIGDPIGNAFTSVGKFMSSLPDRIMLTVEEIWIKTMANLKIGFLKFAGFLSTIPDRVLLAGRAIYLSDEKVARERAKLDAKATGSQVSIDAIKAQRDTDLEENQLKKDAMDKFEREYDAQAATPVIVSKGGDTNYMGDVYNGPVTSAPTVNQGHPGGYSSQLPTQSNYFEG